MHGQEASPLQELLGHGQIVANFCMACAAIGYYWVIYKVLYRNWYNLRPCHVLLANYLCVTVLAMLWGVTMVLSQEYRNHDIWVGFSDHHFCVLHNVGLSAKLYLLQALVLLQLERYLAVRKPFLSEQITVRHTGHALAVSLTSTLALTALAVIMDRALLVCPAPHANRNYFINPVSISWCPTLRSWPSSSP